MTKLDEILAHKRREVEEKKRELGLKKLRERITPRTDERLFGKALRASSFVEVYPPSAAPEATKAAADKSHSAFRTSLIAEIKRASPSAGLIREDFQATSLARSYEKGGASALSVLTDEKFFQGRLKYLLQARSATRLPCLRKDFIVDEYQIWEARLAEADAILLIAAALRLEELRHFSEVAGEAGLDVLVEAHDEPELELALRADAQIIGINNRNLKTFEVDLKITENLAPKVPKDKILVSESGILGPAEVQRVKACGVHAILVGESLMRQADVESAVRKLLGAP